MAIARVTPTEVSLVVRYFASGNAARNAPAVLDDMNAAVRAFCNDTSVPNTGASRVRSDAENFALRIDDRNGHTRLRTDRPADLCTSAIRDIER